MFMQIPGRLAGAVLAAATVAVLATGPAQANKADDTLRVAMAEDILNLDYNYTTKREYIILSQLTDATLFDLDPKTQEYNPPSPPATSGWTTRRWT